ncbi:hypothetical protein [Catenuloplanes atrovinosus]|uniref:Uncharacterized protein n=1 Tax=Catenuloplanes atrovinosus TaxID=137266 RepID=A0AAE4CES2_9ACTN|nr:hypothetical protein [Catenuloplanes atrovinosus]MDR7278910.1 hypothetical protein [Catenuloplanes atrovinosus]
MSLAYIRRRYAVPARRGARVLVDGQPGRITRSEGARLYVRLDGRKTSVVTHPTWRVEYLGQSPAARRADQLAHREIETVTVAGGAL